MSKKYLIIFAYLLIHTAFISINSQQIYSNSQEHIEKLIQHQQEFLSTQNDSSIWYGNEALNTLKNSDDNSTKAEVLYHMGMAYDLKGEFDKALSIYERALKILEGGENHRIVGEIYNEIGTVQRYSANFDAALEAHLKALEECRNLNDSSGIAKSLNNIGLVYRNAGDINKAMGYYKKALAIRLAMDENWGISETLNNIGSAFWYLKNYSRALGYYQKALALKKKYNLRGIEGAFNNIGNVYRAEGNYSEAKKYYELSLKKSIESKNVKMKCITMKNIGVLSFNKGEYQKALDYLNTAYKIAGEIKLNRIVTEILFVKSEVYEKIDKPFEALRYYKQYNAFRDSFYSTMHTRKVNEYVAKYELDKKENEINILKLASQKNTNLFLMFALVALSLIIFFLYRRYKINTNINAKLIQQKNLITQSKQELELVNRELVRERNNALSSDKLKSEFLAQVSHEIRSPINTILNYTSLIELDFNESLDDSGREYFRSINNAATRLIRTIDLIINMSELEIGSYNPNIHEVNLVYNVLEPITMEYKNTAYCKGLTLDLENSLDSEITVMGDEYTLSQIFTNLIDNAIKYTQKGGIRIIIEEIEKQLVVSIKDTGIGIATEYLPRLFEKFSQEEQGYTRKFEGSGLGLALVKEYCRINKATVEVESVKEKGSTFKIVFHDNFSAPNHKK